ncbi:MAG: NAD-dependent dehydratase [Methanobacterium sp.]|nr:MAG: NAD-dependent dehydratase [Methanobacterium sp.]
MNLKKKKVLITGAGGFIGSHLTEYLIDLGADVKAFVRYNSRNDRGMLESLPQEKIDLIEVITGDLRDSDAIRYAASDVSVIFHLGSLIAIPYSYIHPRETIETNVMGTLSVLTAAKDLSIDKVVHTSTSEVYGTAKYVPIDENHQLQGQSPYSASKIGADKIAESFYKSYELPVSVIRPFNTYGPRQSARAVIPTIITQALKTDKISLGSLHPTRDYTHVQDTVKGFLKVAESSRSIGEVINIGSNFEISIKNLAEKIFHIMGKEVQIVTDSPRFRPKDSEVERLWCDNTKAKDILGWKPEISLDNGLKDVLNWISENIDFYKANIYNK